MCQFGTEKDIIRELNLSKEEALTGWRNNYIINSFNYKEKALKSIHFDYLFPKGYQAEGKGLERYNSLGIYNYYNNNNNYNNYYYYYYIQIKTIHYGKVFEYKEGYRSEFCIPTHLIILDKDSKWFEDKNTIKFANHFNELSENLAKEYKCEVMEFSKRK